MDLRIYQLRLTALPTFLRLRTDIERESPYLSVSGGERRDGFLYTLLRMIVNRRRSRIFIAADGSDAIGYIYTVLGRFKKFRGNAYIAVVSIKQSHQGKGVGTRLMQTVEDFAKSRNIGRLELEVFAKNERAIALYERLGYQQEGRKRRAVQNHDGFDDIVFMAKLLH
jgi:RimJ/RimL family protein N-acetyltransferase